MTDSISGTNTTRSCSIIVLRLHPQSTPTPTGSTTTRRLEFAMATNCGFPSPVLSSSYAAHAFVGCRETIQRNCFTKESTSGIHDGIGLWTSFFRFLRCLARNAVHVLFGCRETFVIIRERRRGSAQTGDMSSHSPHAFIGGTLMGHERHEQSMMIHNSGISRI